ncbi:MAG: stage 0 sporulation family protein [Clostridia bacterium]|nr:stage 0 sporulation family protein [Clostridia bacterium]
MAMVVKVRFRRASKLYDFDANGLEIGNGSYIVTETVRGVEIGECMSDLREVSEKSYGVPLKPILRIATDEDLAIQQENVDKEKQALQIAEQKVLELKLDMKLVDVEYSFDRTKITFYFTADGRVDFRILVKSLASVFKTRIELRQIGVRDEAKMLGGLGPCGRPICCRQFLVDFQPVSIKMAKEQNLSLNPTKISGICDRLMCCLKYEQDHYESTRKKMPKIGRELQTPDGIGMITAINVLSETVTVRLPVGDSFENRTYAIDDCSRVDRNAPAAVPKMEIEEPDGEEPDTEMMYQEAEEPAQDEDTDENEVIPAVQEEVPKKRKKRHSRRPSAAKAAAAAAAAAAGENVLQQAQKSEDGSEAAAVGEEKKPRKPRSSRNRRRDGRKREGKPETGAPEQE